MTLGLSLALFLAAATTRPPDAPDLQTGIDQLNEGDFPAALLTLDAVIQRLAPEAETRAKELAKAHLYKGVAYVGLMQEEPAKASFREALRYDPALRLLPGQFPDRVVRVFDAARTGKTKSVMQRPSGAPKKTGIGAAAVAAIVGGVALAGGAAAAAVSGSEPTPSPAPAVTPSSYSVMLTDQRNCGAQGHTVNQSGTLTARVAISPPLRCIQFFCFGSGTLGSNCLNTERTVTDGATVGISNVAAGQYGLWFCDCESEPQKRVPMTVTVTLTYN